MSGLEQHFNKVEPRENAGAPTSDRYQYQRDWALCKLLKLHAGTTDYLMAFDIHDDVLVFEPESDPQTICFFQIKSKQGGDWTANRLTSRTKGKDKKELPSIIGKLYGNYLLFPGFTKSLTLVSNMPFRLAVDAKGKAAVLASDLCVFNNIADKPKKTFVGKLVLEHTLSADPVLEQLLWFEKTDLPLEGHSTFTKGRLAEFLEARKPGKYPIGPAYRVLADEIQRRNDFSKKKLSLSQTRKHKAIGRTDFEKILADAVPDDTAEKTWLEVFSTLTSEGFTLQQIRHLKQAWQRVEVSRIDASDSAFWKLADIARPISDQYADIRSLLSSGLAAVKGKLLPTMKYDDDFLAAVSLMIAYGVL